MKNFLLALLALAFLTGCADTEVKLTKKLDGTWNLTSVKEGTEELIGDDYLYSKFTFVDQGEGSGIVTNEIGYDLTPGDEDIELYSQFFTLVSEGDIERLHFIEYGDTTTLVVQELTGTTLRLFQDNGDPEDNVTIVGEKE